MLTKIEKLWWLPRDQQPIAKPNERQHGDRLDRIDDVTGNGPPPLHAMELIANRPRGQ
jgi:hypothetical protein